MRTPNIQPTHSLKTFSLHCLFPIEGKAPDFLIWTDYWHNFEEKMFLCNIILNSRAITRLKLSSWVEIHCSTLYFILHFTLWYQIQCCVMLTPFESNLWFILDEPFQWIYDTSIIYRLALNRTLCTFSSRKVYLVQSVSQIDLKVKYLTKFCCFYIMLTKFDNWLTWKISVLPQMFSTDHFSMHLSTLLHMLFCCENTIFLKSLIPAMFNIWIHVLISINT